MIRALRRKLALLLIAFIALVVLCTAGAALAISEHQLSMREQARFLAHADQVAQDVGIGRLIESAQLAKTEAANDLIISILDNGGPIAFRGGWRPLTERSTLIARAMASAPEAAQRWDGAVTGDHGERYLAAVRRISGYRSAQAVVMLQDMRMEDAQRLKQRFMFAGVALAALAVLALFSWFFTGRAMRPIEEAHKKQNQFVAAASHELRTPLQVIHTAMEAKKLNPPDAERFTEQIFTELTHMGKLTQDLLILTAAPNGKRGKGDPVESGALILRAFDQHSAAAAQKGVKLSLPNPPAPLPLLEGNELMLQRALNVLIDNAICYTPSGGHVTVAVSMHSRTIEISVQDDGPGIAPEHRPHIYERFYRSDKSRTDRAHSGLGLSIARQIIVNHGGQLTYSPVKPHGSRFTMILPLIQKNAEKI